MRHAHCGCKIGVRLDFGKDTLVGVPTNKFSG